MCGNMGGGSISQNIGTQGTGIAYKAANGRIVNYFVASDGLRRIDNAEKMSSRNLSTKELTEMLIEKGKATFLSKSQIDELRKKRQEERAKTPDYELGNPFGERGRGKNIYRPRRAK